MGLLSLVALVAIAGVAFTLLRLGGPTTLSVHATLGSDGFLRVGDRPFATIQAALDHARPGDTIVVYEGIYEENVETRRNGERGKPIIVQSVPARAAVISGRGNALTVRHSHYVFEGFVVDGAYERGRTVRMRGDIGHVTFRDLEVRHSSSNCLDLNGADVLIERCEIHHCLKYDSNIGRVRDAHGIAADEIERLTVRDSVIYLFTGDGIQISPGRLHWDEVLVERTRIWSGPLPESVGAFEAGQRVGENAFDSKVMGESRKVPDRRPRIVFRDVEAFGFAGVIENQAAFNLKEGVDATIDGATVSGNDIAFRIRSPALVAVRNVVTHDNGITFRYEGPFRSIAIEHGTFTDPRPFLGTGGHRVADVVARNNVFTGVSTLPAEAPATASNRLAAAREFVDPAANDYRPARDAAVIDAAIPLPGVDRDRAGNPRPYGPRPDVGAFEWSGE